VPAYGNKILQLSTPYTHPMPTNSSPREPQTLVLSAIWRIN